MMKTLTLAIALLSCLFVSAQDSVQNYYIGGDRVLIYKKPVPFGFITRLPRDAGDMVTSTFNKKSVKPLLFIAGASVGLYLADQAISDGVKGFCRDNGIQASEEYGNSIDLKVLGKKTSVFKLPRNLNTGLYQLGQGFPSLLIGVGLFTYGKINKDYRALSTSSQLAESFILMGITTQVLKRVTGRQSPSESTTPRGNWKFLPSFKQFQNHTANYDAFPSGHLATLMSSVTILAENYPEKRWIKPVGYSAIGGVGLAMINNDVHWASDFPLALGLGYICAKVVAMHNRRIERIVQTKHALTLL